MQVIEQRGTNRSAPGRRGGGRKRDTEMVIRAQERNAGAMGHSPIAPRVATLRTGWPRGAQFRLALLRRKPEIITGRGLRAHWRESLRVYSPRVRESVHRRSFAFALLDRSTTRRPSARIAILCGIISLACTS
jgi:hypothetical protein